MTDVPDGCCHCGCGEQTPISKLTGEPTRFLTGHHRRKPLRWTVDENGCWIWGGRFDRKGYGRVGSGTQAHTFTYEQAKGPVPAGLQLDHLCRVRACVNPDHLEPVTSAENQRRGERTKLNPDAVREIRRSSESDWHLAVRFGVHPNTIWAARTGRYWADITDEEQPSGGSPLGCVEPTERDLRWTESRIQSRAATACTCCTSPAAAASASSNPPTPPTSGG